MSFTLEVLPAEHGDCLLLSWGPRRDERHLLIDGGPDDGDVRAALLDAVEERLTSDTDRLEALVVTHIDADHIGGLVRLLRDGLPWPVADVWFNGWDHMPVDVLGVAQAEEVTTRLVELDLPWNEAFGGARVAVPDAPHDPLPRVELPGGLTITVLGPTVERLRRLARDWRRACEEAGIVPGVDPGTRRERPARATGPADALGDAALDLPALAAVRFRQDASRANGASISLLAEHDGRSVLLTGDAFAGDVVDGLRRLERERGAPVTVDVCKLPHHGSRANVSRELVRVVAAARWIVSSSGRQFHHPDPEALARVVLEGGDDPELIFNYRSEESEVWDDRALRRRHGFSTTYPRRGASGIRVEI